MLWRNRHSVHQKYQYVKSWLWVLCPMESNLATPITITCIYPLTQQFLSGIYPTGICAYVQNDVSTSLITTALFRMETLTVHQ